MVSALLRLIKRPFSNVVFRRGFITFRERGFASSPGSLPEFSAKLYNEVRLIRELVQRHGAELPVDRSLEVGAGYGRLSPWLADFARSAVSLEPNQNAAALARRQYPHIHFIAAMGQALPLPDRSVDLVVFWTVLQHIPPAGLPEVAAEVDRVLRPEGLVLLAENARQGDGRHVWSRSGSDYARLFGRELLHSEPKPVERSDRFGEEGRHPKDVVHVLGRANAAGR